MDSTVISNIQNEVTQLIYTVIAAAVAGLFGLITGKIHERTKNAKK